MSFGEEQGRTHRHPTTKARNEIGCNNDVRHARRGYAANAKTSRGGAVVGTGGEVAQSSCIAFSASKPSRAVWCPLEQLFSWT